MKSDSLLLDLLRCELDATNQQFTHILALQAWNLNEAATRIAEVDSVDFVNAMRIVEYLVQSGIPVAPGKAEFNPGTGFGSILRAEQSMEARLAAVLARSTDVESPARHLIEAAAAPRTAYAQWLTGKISAASPDRAPIATPAMELEGLVTHLITMIEQSMAHAFVEWHGGDRRAADAAWASSGAAMMQLTHLVRLFATLPGVPSGGSCPPASICQRAGDTFAADRDLALRCARQSDAAALGCAHPAIAKYCASIAGYYREFATWNPAQAHPASVSNPPVFHSFATTRAKFVE